MLLYILTVFSTKVVTIVDLVALFQEVCVCALVWCVCTCVVCVWYVVLVIQLLQGLNWY